MALNEDQSADIKWALGALAEASATGAYGTFARYYNGDHPLNFISQKFRETFGDTFRAARENLCRLPVDILADLLQVEGFAGINDAGSETVNADTQEVWRRNRMAERSGHVHKNTALFGEAYVVVWPDENGVPVIYPNLPANVVVEYHAEQLGYIVRAAKFWIEAGNGRMTVYKPDTITRYATRNKANVLPQSSGAFDLYETDNIPAEQANEFKKVPVFRFVNNSGIGSYGESELIDVIPPQDRLNKAICDLLIASEYSAYPQRYAIGVDIKYDDAGNPINPFVSGPARMWAVEHGSGDKSASIGQLNTGDLQQYLDMINDARQSIVRISGIPAHYLGFASGGFPSGESLKTASERLTRKALDRQESYGSTWADVMRFCLQVMGKADVELETVWTDPTPRLSELESWQAATAEQLAGGSIEKTLRERGYAQSEIDEANESAFSEAKAGRAPMITNG